MRVPLLTEQKTSSLEEFFHEARRWTAVFDEWARKNDAVAVADHICYKCGDSAEFERMRAMLETRCRFVYQSIIAGRRIAIAGFAEALPTALGDIRFLELSDQKPDGSRVSGFDHIEIHPLEGTMDGLAERLEEKGTAFKKVVRPHHTTYDAFIEGDFKVRLEDEPLIEKIKKEEMV